MPHVSTRPDGNAIQTLVFSRRKWTPTTARAWADKRGFYSSNARMDIRERSIYLRQYNPEDFDALRWIPIGTAHNGVHAVYGVQGKVRKGKRRTSRR